MQVKMHCIYIEQSKTSHSPINYTLNKNRSPTLLILPHFEVKKIKTSYMQTKVYFSLMLLSNLLKSVLVSTSFAKIDVFFFPGGQSHDLYCSAFVLVQFQQEE